MSFAIIRRELQDLYGRVRPGVPIDALDRLQERYSVSLPEDLKAAYQLMDGADDSTDPKGSWIRFWSIQEFVPAARKLPRRTLISEECRPFVLADYAINCVYYVIDLAPRSESFGSVFALGATRVVEVAKSFDQFVQLVIADDKQLQSYS